MHKRSTYSSRIFLLLCYILPISSYYILNLRSYTSRDLRKISQTRSRYIPDRSKFNLKVSPNYIIDQISVRVYDTQLAITTNLETAFSNPSLFGCCLLLTAGILSSLSPCSLSMIPLTTIYLGSGNTIDNNYVANDSINKHEQPPDRNDSTTTNRLIKSCFYASGLAFTFTLLGLIASLSGQFFITSSNTEPLSSTFTVKDFSSLATALFAIVMGLNVLELIPIGLFNSFANTIDFQKIRKQMKLSWQSESFAFGATAALALSPCSSPVLASLLALVSNSGNPALGTLYLFFYSLGYSLPTVLAVNSSLDFVKSSLQASATSQYVNVIFGSALIIFGTYFALDTYVRNFLV